MPDRPSLLPEIPKAAFLLARPDTRRHSITDTRVTREGRKLKTHLMATDLIPLAARLAPERGINHTRLPRVQLFKETANLLCPKCMVDPTMVFVLQGRKREIFGKYPFNLTPENVMIVSLPLPLEAEIIGASEDMPFYALTITIDMTELAQLMQDVPNRAVAPGPVTPVTVAGITDDLRGALGRLMKALADETDARVIAPQVCRELVYYMLREDPGGALPSLVHNHGARLRVGRIIEDINAAPEQKIDVSDLVARARMSKSAFFALFKEMTAHSPIQYQKSVRLHRARAMIVNEGRAVSDAAFRVGYSTATQFSRDYSRFFNVTAKEDLQAAR